MALINAIAGCQPDAIGMVNAVYFFRFLPATHRYALTSDLFPAIATLLDISGRGVEFHMA